MAIIFDRHIQKTHSPTTLTRTELAPLNLGEVAVLRAEPAGLRDTGPWSNYAFSQPSPVDDDAKPSVTQHTSPSASPETDTSLQNDFYEFIEAREPGAYSEFSPVTLNNFLSLKPDLDLISETNYIYFAQERTLIVMVNSDPHENVIVTLRDIFREAMVTQNDVNPSLTNAWLLHTNRSVWYSDHQGDHYTSDMTLFFHSTPEPASLFNLEVGFTQSWGNLCRKIDRMLVDPDTWGVLVVRIKENSSSSWSKPTKTPKHGDFVSADHFEEETHRAQTADEYGALRVNGLVWMRKVTCEVRFFPSDWEIGLPLPQAYPLNGDREAFIDLDQQLAKVWSSIIQDVGNRLQCQVDPIELAVDWHRVHKMVLDGLRSTAFKRYLGWFGEGRYRKLKAEMQGAQAEETMFRPRKRVRTA